MYIQSCNNYIKWTITKSILESNSFHMLVQANSDQSQLNFPYLIE